MSPDHEYVVYVTELDFLSFWRLSEGFFFKMLHEDISNYIKNGRFQKFVHRIDCCKEVCGCLTVII